VTEAAPEPAFGAPKSADGLCAQDSCATRSAANAHRDLVPDVGRRRQGGLLQGVLRGERTFQWYETSVFLAAALALAGLCFWLIRRRLT
jgi:hypothetical protein